MTLREAVSESHGFKRKIVTVLAVVLDILRALPVVSEYVPIMEQFLGLFGGTAILHATVDRQVTKEVMGGMVAAIYVIIAIVQWLPEEYHFILPMLKQGAGVIAAARLGIGVKELAEQRRLNNPNKP
jgi:hypothetical protein